MSDSYIDNIWTPECDPPPGYKIVVHRYYTEIVPEYVNVPKTPIKKHRFVYNDYNDKNDKDDKDDKDDKNDKNDTK